VISDAASYFGFRQQDPVQPLAVNIIYCTYDYV